MASDRLSRRTGKANGALIRWQARGHHLADVFVQGIALFEGVFGSVDWLKKFDQDLSRVNHQLALSHYAVSARADHWHNRHTRRNRHHDSALLEFLQAAIRTARPFLVDQERLSGLEGFARFLHAGNRRIAGAAIHTDEM